MIKFIVVADLHGNREALETLYTKFMIPRDPEDRAAEGLTVIQIGDWLHLGHHRDEGDFAKETFDYFDVHLIGNHEYPLIAPDPLAVTFGGFSSRQREAEEVFRGLYDPASWQMATSVGDWVITHAGIHPFLYDMHPKFYPGMPADNVASMLNAMWETYVDQGGPVGDRKWTYDARLEPIFDWIPNARGGMEPVGGILWNDWADLSSTYKSEIERFMVRKKYAKWDKNNVKRIFPYPKQIVGHTPINHLGCISTYPGTDRYLYNIDIGAKHVEEWKLVALESTNTGKSWKPLKTDHFDAARLEEHVGQS